MGEGLRQTFGSPKVEDVGAFADSRGLYMVLDGVDSAQEIAQILGPELLDNGHVDTHAIMSVGQMGELFGQWAQQGR
ncbi:MAG: hypothetical protein M3281_02695 [Chloroflexota bacterium]|nr:hypothetical protein [Chloroflexota bacterium]